KPWNHISETVRNDQQHDHNCNLQPSNFSIQYNLFRCGSEKFRRRLQAIRPFLGSAERGAQKSRGGSQSLYSWRLNSPRREQSQSRSNQTPPTSCQGIKRWETKSSQKRIFGSALAARLPPSFKPRN